MAFGGVQPGDPGLGHRPVGDHWRAGGIPYHVEAGHGGPAKLIHRRRLAGLYKQTGRLQVEPVRRRVARNRDVRIERDFHRTKPPLQRLGRLVESQLAAIQDRHLVSQPLHLLDVMRRNENAPTLLLRQFE